MKRIRMIALLLAAALLFICCAGCAKTPAETASSAAPSSESGPAPSEAPTAAPTDSSPDATEPTEPAGEIPVRWQNGGYLCFLPQEPLEVPKLSEMEYVRPDLDALIAQIEALTEKAPGCDDPETLLQDYYAISVGCQNYVSMTNLAYFRYCMDTTDSWYADEYSYCNEKGGVVDEKLNALLAAFAASPCRDALEKAYFGKGYFRNYDEFSVADDTYYDLLEQENDLLFRYYDLAGAADLTSAREIRKNHEAAGEIFIELVKVRRQIAAAKGYDNYMDYIYACGFNRDYTPAQAREYLDQVRLWLAPLTQEDRIVDASYSSWRETKVMEMLSNAAERMGGPILDSFRFLSDRELYDISYGRDKMSTAFTSYIGNYEAPFIFVDPGAKDLVTALFHEYGHFTDWYCNYGVAGDYETGETFSQAMQYLGFAYADPFSDSARAMNLRATLSDLLIYSVLMEGAYADFELQVYALPPEELTVERLDAIFGQCIMNYGLAGLDDFHFMREYWSVYLHFFAYPGYVISYSDSAVAALQICRLEAEKPGAGVNAFCRLLKRHHGKKFAAVLADAGLDSPFEAATLEKTAEFLRKAFDLD